MLTLFCPLHAKGHMGYHDSERRMGLRHLSKYMAGFEQIKKRTLPDSNLRSPIAKLLHGGILDANIWIVFQDFFDGCF